MSDDKIIDAKKIAKTSIRTTGDIILLILRIIGAILLTAVTTGIIFACIFVIYVKTNLSTEFNINTEDFERMDLSSVICYIDSAGNEVEMVTLQSKEYRIWVDYDHIPRNMVQALIAIEDQRFYKHNGVDWYRTAGAFVNMFLSMRDTFGGSTITQQVIKNFTNEDEVTVQRKLREIFRALEFEKQYEKENILELYMNFVYFGHGCYGVAAAADYYFGKELDELTVTECASIIAITNNPSIFSPYVSRENNKERRDTILYKMFELGYIKSEQEYRKALNEEPVFQRGEDSEYEQVVYSWFEEAIIKDVTRDLIAERGYSEQLANRLLYTGGYKIIATIDMDMQAMVDSVYKDTESLPKVTGSAQQLQSAIVIADPYTGEIKALSGGVGNKTRNMLLNRATMTRRPPGSSLKPLAVYAPAMEYGLITPDTKYDDSASAKLDGTDWMPRNDNRSYTNAPVDIRTALRRSLNTVAAQVLDDLKPSVSYRFLKDTLGFGLDRADEDYAPLSLGQLTYGATVREMASGFTMFPNGGERMELRTYTKVYDNDGKVVLDNTRKATRAISETTAYWMTNMLAEAATSGTGHEANLKTMPTAGKTGTTSDKKDRWFVGFTPYYVAAVWTGYDTPAVMTASGNPASQIWKTIMTMVHEDLEKKEFNKPENVYQAPVAGVPTAEYTVRCIDVQGNTMQSESVSSVVGRVITKSAPEIDGYILIGESEKTITVTEDPSRNVIEFGYEPMLPEVSEEPPDVTDDPLDPNSQLPDATDDPFAPTEEPTSEPSPEPSAGPSAEPTPEPSEEPAPQIPGNPDGPYDPHQE